MLSRCARRGGRRGRAPERCGEGNWPETRGVHSQNRSHESVRSEYARTLFQPAGRKKIAHGASHGDRACATEPRKGRKMAAARSFAPCRGFVDLAVSPRLTPWAIFFRSTSLHSERSRIPTLMFRTLRNSRFHRIRWHASNLESTWI